VSVHKRLFFSGIRRRAFAAEWQRRREESFCEQESASNGQPGYRCDHVGAGELCRFETGEQHQVMGHDRGPGLGDKPITAAVLRHIQVMRVPRAVHVGVNRASPINFELGRDR
jgi:hypothetical protein